MACNYEDRSVYHLMYSIKFNDNYNARRTEEMSSVKKILP